MSDDRYAHFELEFSDPPLFVISNQGQHLCFIYKEDILECFHHARQHRSKPGLWITEFLLLVREAWCLVTTKDRHDCGEYPEGTPFRPLRGLLKRLDPARAVVWMLEHGKPVPREMGGILRSHHLPVFIAHDDAQPPPEGRLLPPCSEAASQRDATATGADPHRASAESSSASVADFSEPPTKGEGDKKANGSTVADEVDPFDLSDLSPIEPLPRTEVTFLVEDQAGKSFLIYPGQYDAYGPETYHYMEEATVAENWLLRLKDGRWVEISCWIDMEELAMTGRGRSEGIIEGKFEFVDERHALLWLIRNNIEIPEADRRQLEGMSLLNHPNKAEPAATTSIKARKDRPSDSAIPGDEAGGIADTSAAPAPLRMTPLRKAILKFLDGNALKTDSLQNKLDKDRSQMFRDGINPLTLHGLVSHRPGFGFYRPDAPPSNWPAN